MSILNTILFPVSSWQSILECSVLNLRIFIAKKHLIKWIIVVRYKIDNTENWWWRCIVFTKNICNLVKCSNNIVVFTSIPFCQVERDRCIFTICVIWFHVHASCRNAWEMTRCNRPAEWLWNSLWKETGLPVIVLNSTFQFILLPYSASSALISVHVLAALCSGKLQNWVNSDS